MKKRKRKKKGRITSARQGRRISLRVASHLYFNNLKKNSGPYLFCTVASMMQCQHPCTANRSTVTLQLVTSQIMIPANYSDDDVHVVGMEGLVQVSAPETGGRNSLVTSRHVRTVRSNKHVVAYYGSRPPLHHKTNGERRASRSLRRRRRRGGGRAETRRTASAARGRRPQRATAAGASFRGGNKGLV